MFLLKRDVNLQLTNEGAILMAKMGQPMTCLVVDMPKTIQQGDRTGTDWVY